MQNKILSIVLAVLLVTTLLVAVAPSAEAQKPKPALTVKITPTTDKVKPLQGQISIRGTLDYIIEAQAAGQLTGIPITYTAIGPAWASVTVSPASDVIALSGAAPGGATITGTKTFDIIVSATDLAPAFSPANIEVTAVAGATSITDQAQQKGQTPVQADFFSIVDVQLAEAIKVARPQEPVVFPLTITNFGNANTKVSFEVVQVASNLKDGIVIPNPVTLQSKQAGGNQITATVPLTVQTPYKNGYLNEVGTVTYKITSAYALDSKLKGDESQVSVLVTTKGFYVPGFSPIFLVGLLGLVAVLARRKH